MSNIYKPKTSDYSVTISVTPDKKGETEEQAKKLADKYVEDIQKFGQTAMLNPKGLEREFGITETSQKNFRNRIGNPLPYVQLKERGNILYNRKDIEDWMNQHNQVSIFD